MIMQKLTDLQQLSLDVLNNSVKNFSKTEGEDVIRKAIIDACGGQWDVYKFLDNKYKVYAIMAEVLSVSLGNTLTDQFDMFTDFRNVPLGDKPEFIVEDTNLFRVASVADGNMDIRRQKLYSGKVPITTFNLALKIYADFDMFLAGRIDWAAMVNRVKLSFSHEVGGVIYRAIYNSYGNMVAPYAESGAFTETMLADIIAHVEAQTGQKASIYGTKKALGKVKLDPLYLSNSMKDELNVLGHPRQFQGTTAFELPQAHKPGTTQWEVDDSFLLVIPDNEKIVKFILEGDAKVFDTPESSRNDMQLEYFFSQKVGVGVLQSNIYGMYKLS